MTHKKTLCALAAASMLAAGCADLPPGAGENPVDPYEGFNRNVYAFNDALDRAVLKPVAKGYRSITPDPVERGVSRMVDNLFVPSHALNNTLQGKVDDGIGSAFRFLVNSTFGLAGAFDVASWIGLEEKPEDFGQTLGVWGVPSGPYLMLPFIGPSSARDVWRYPEEFATSPITYITWNEDWWIGWSATGVMAIDARARLLEYEDLRKNTVDEYVAIRDAYLARREKLVRDGAAPDESEELESLTPLDFGDE